MPPEGSDLIFDHRHNAAMRVIDKQAVAGFVGGDGQSSGSGNRGVVPVCHGERERRLPMVSGGPYGIDKSALGLPLLCAWLGPLKGSGPWTLRSTICSSARTCHDLAIAWEPSWGAIRRRAARSLGGVWTVICPGRQHFANLLDSSRPARGLLHTRRSLVRSQYRPQM